MKTSLILAIAAFISVDASYAIAAGHKSADAPSQIENLDMQALALGQPALPGRSGADCGPDRTESVLGANGAILGYVCAGASANGS